MSDTLADICAKKREHIAQQKALVPEAKLVAQARISSTSRGFRRTLQDKVKQGHCVLIGEIKKASPSKGIIREDFNPGLLARAYADGGATCLSVLTDEPYFMGKDADLTEARDRVPLPVLRKDFMLDPYQVIESRVLGADCILLIMAALTDAQAQELEALAMKLGMDVLVEVHDKPELDRALGCLKSTLIGINNRNLKTLEVDLSTAQTLAKHLPPTILGVCESGITKHDDMKLVQAAGISCFLVGESLMREQDVSLATQRLLGLNHG